MINIRYRVEKPKQIVEEFVDEKIDDTKVIVRPRFLSICAADRRYYFGTRPKEILRKKLPLALIHETIGRVVFDPQQKIPIGTKVVLCPLVEHTSHKSEIKSNYDPVYKFRSSSEDGYMQSVCVVDRNEIVPFTSTEHNEKIFVITELLAVAVSSLGNVKHVKDEEVLGIWGDGPLGYIMAALLKTIYPKAKIVIFGKNEGKLQYFTFVDKIVHIDEDMSDIKIDNAFECVGGMYSGNAINQIIDVIRPQGSIMLLGVSENLVDINTRMVLEKGLSMFGSSRANKEDFKVAVELLENNPKLVGLMEAIISNEVDINNIKDMEHAFEISLNSDFKVIMKWSV